MKWLTCIFLFLSWTARADYLDWSSPNQYGMRIVFAPTNGGEMQFDFPFAPNPIDPPNPLWGKVGYILKRATPEVPLAIKIKLRVESDNPQYVSLDPNDVPPPRVRAMFMSSETYDLAEPGIIPYEFRRWWARDVSYTLGTLDSKEITLEAPLAAEAWSSVYGVVGTQANGWFEYAKDHMVWSGFSFGNRFYGHGFRLQAGATRFVLRGYEIIESTGWVRK